MLNPRRIRMRSVTRVVLCAALQAAIVPSGWSQEPAVRPFPSDGLLPKKETAALRFLEQHPEFDGRGVVVAIFDTGIDPGAAGLSRTADGRPKFVDLVDGTGDGDVVMSEPQAADDGKLEGLTGRSLTLNPEWNNPSGKYRLGLKRAYDVFPPELIERFNEERLVLWERTQRNREAALRRQLSEWDDSDGTSTSQQRVRREELEAQLEVLADGQENFEDPGPLYDCVLFHDGAVWRAVVDTDEDGDLADEAALTDYHREHQFASFGEQTQLNFSVNIYEDGDLLSIVTPSGSHGTHVAGIVAAFEPDHPDRNGLAPGAQLVSVKIGDNRIDGMETGRALVRGLRTVIDRKCDLINMSYGEPTSTPNRGRLTDLFTEVVREHGVIFVASAGNEGPALATVGAPGGTTEALLGIGAYVSQDMMSPQYGLLETFEGIPYTWTSRGPTTDGAFGTDLFAPGGAFSPVPRYELRRTMQANGTSMSSPNACGNVALLLSGLKATGIPFTPAQVRRALENTALRLANGDVYAEGAGLIQTDRAWDWLQSEELVPAESFFYEIAVGADSARGVLLREPGEIRDPLETSVRVQPQYRRDEPKPPQVEFEIPVTLETTAPWVRASEAILLTSAGESFELRVDPRSLGTGLHTAEVRGYFAGRESRGPLFRVPITVIKPRLMPPHARLRPAPGDVERRLDAVQRLRAAGVASFQQDKTLETLVLGPGKIERRFLVVPDGATWLDLHFELDDADSARTFIAHTVQLLPGHSYRTGESQIHLTMEQGSRTVRSLPVVEGRTIEICVAQYWASLGDSRLKMSMEFRGLLPDDDDLTLPSDGSPLEVAVTSSVRRERCGPNGRLTTLRRLHRAVSAEMEVLGSDRDRQLDGGSTQQLILTYEFNLPESGDVTIRVPELDGLLYDAPTESHEWLLFDANKRLIATDDMYPEPVPLEEGDYTVRLELRHADRSVLEVFESVSLAVDREDVISLAVQAWASPADAAARDEEYNPQWLDPGEQVTVFLTGPTTDDMPERAEPGDILLGTMNWVSSPNGIAGARSRPGGYPVSFVVPPLPEVEDDSEPPGDEPDESLAERLKRKRSDDLIEQLGQLTWPDDEALFDELSATIRELDPDTEQQVLIARLKLLDDENRTERLSEVVQAADQVIASIKRSEIALRLGRRTDPGRPQEVRARKTAEQQRDILADALYRKGRALAFQELPEVVEERPIADQKSLDREFEETSRELSRWVDTTSSDYYLLQIRRDRRAGRYGMALKLLNQHIEDSFPPEQLQIKKRRDLYELLGWDDWREYEHKWLLIDYPDDWPPF